MFKAANDGEDPGQHVGVLARTPGSTRRTLAVVRCIAGTVKAQFISRGLMIVFVGYDPDKTRVTVRRATEGGHPLWLALRSFRDALQPGEATRENSSGLCSKCKRRAASRAGGAQKRRPSHEAGPRWRGAQPRRVATPQA